MEMLNVLLGNSMFDEYGNMLELTDAELSAMRAEVLAYYNAEMEPITFAARAFDPQNSTSYGETMTFAVVGIFEDKDSYNFRFYLNDEQASGMWDEQLKKFQWHTESTTKYSPTEDDIYHTGFLAYDHSDAATDAVTALYVNRDTYGEDDTTFALTGTVAMTFEMVDGMVSEFSKIFLYVGLVMAAFSALLLSNFISVSISAKRREIGILRAVGARSFDVFKIFFSESFFITAICVAISLIGSFVICGVVNNSLNELLGASLFVFGVLSVIVLLAVAFATAVIATFLPVYNAAKRRPVESIRAL